MPMLYIVATPIGNLEDITLRALRVLKEVDFILCEDTRQTRKLTDKYGINKPLISYHQHSRLQKLEFILQLLKEGKNLALVSDAGTPGISDPGNLLVSWLVSKLEGFKVVPIPGPSAVTAALSISGLPTDRFLFLGFPPHKKRRKQFFECVVQSKELVIFYESPHRLLKTLQQLTDALRNKRNGRKKAEMVVCRELTKIYEEIIRGSPEEVLKFFKEHSGKIRGEFVVIIKAEKRGRGADVGEK